MPGRVGLSLKIGLIAAALHTWSIDQHASVIDDVQDHAEAALQRTAVDHGHTTNLDEVLGLFEVSSGGCIGRVRWSGEIAW